MWTHLLLDLLTPIMKNEWKKQGSIDTSFTSIRKIGKSNIDFATAFEAIRTRDAAAPPSIATFLASLTILIIN